MVLASANIVFSLLASQATSRLMTAIEYRIELSYAMRDSPNTSTDLEELSRAVTAQEDAMATVNFFEFMAIASSVLFAVISIAGVLVILRKIGLINHLLELVYDVTHGKISVNINRENIPNDEIGVLTHDIIDLIDTIKAMVDDLTKIEHEYNIAGDIEYRVDAEKYRNSFKEVIESVNRIQDNTVKDVNNLLDSLSRIADGDFDIQIDDLPGKKMAIPNTLRAFVQNKKYLYDSVTYLARSAADGKLDTEVDSSKFKGDWAGLVRTLNDLMKAISKPMHESHEVMVKMAVGDFNTVVSGAYKGEFAVIKASMNSMQSAISSYVMEIGNILSEISEKNLIVEVSRDYVGDFKIIKDSIGMIIDSLSSVIQEIQAASVEVESGAGQISASTLELRTSFDTQVSFMDSVMEAVNVLTEKTRSNANDASSANTLSMQVQHAAKEGSQHMEDMSSSIDGIKVSSSEIAEVASLIEGIAFQTNLLALNASVEAARAGEHGKGFAVVAEEVRNLAGRSAAAAKDTTEMIAKSLIRVDEGVAKSKQTASALQKIVETTADVASVMANIAQASVEQVEEISKIQNSMEEVYQSIKDDIDTVANNASVSEELSNQASTLRYLVEQFKV